MTSPDFLPVFEDGVLVPFAGLKTLCYLTMPKDTVGAERAFQIMRDENLAIQAESQQGYTRIAHLVQKEMARPLTLGRFSGFVALQMRHNRIKRGAGLFNQAIHVVSRHYEAQKSATGKAAPSDPKRLRVEFGRHKPMIHFWAALASMGDSEAILPVLQGGPPFFEFLVIAADFQNFVLGSHLVHNFTPIRVPQEIDNAEVRSTFVVNYPEEPPWVEDELAHYTVDKIR